ncbi:RNA-directed DNA polymerase, eukaryota, reverse transcriptase zinc-binding domain protein, partial [Tanacetum coccineum]
SNKGMRIKVRKEKRNDGFVGDLTGIQFPPINGMVENVNEEIEGQKDCLGNGDNCKNGSAKSDDCVAIVNEGYASCNNEHGVEVNDDVEEVVKKTNEVKNETLQSVDNSLDVVWNLMKPSITLGECEIGLDLEMSLLKMMVNNKPLVVQKWSIDMCLDKAEPKKILVWVKMINVPMKAWSVKEISALASSIGKPVIMDEITAMMCVTRELYTVQRSVQRSKTLYIRRSFRSLWQKSNLQRTYTGLEGTTEGRKQKRNKSKSWKI